MSAKINEQSQKQELLMCSIRWWGIATLCLLLIGCVAPMEVKKASSEVGAALSALQEAQSDFRNIYIRELEETRQLVARAIIANAVVRKVGTLSEEEVQGDLITISKVINGEREAYRTFVDELLNQQPEMNQSAGEEEASKQAVDSLIKKRVPGLRNSAKALQLAGKPESAKKLQQRAEELNRAVEGFDQYGDLAVLVELESTKEDVRQGIADLDAYRQFLQQIHAQVHEWISTDLNVEGEEVATLIEKHSSVLGLESLKGGAQ